MSLKYYKLSDICDIEKGKTGISQAVKGQYPLIATAEEFKSSNTFDFDCKAVCIPLVSSTGHGHASINRLHYYDGKFALGTILAKMTSKDEELLDTKYLYIYLSFFKDEVLVPLMKGSANVSLTITSLSSLEIPVPRIDTQKKIKELYLNVNPLSILVNKEHENQFDNIPKLREKVLDLAFRGLLVPQSQNDENAMILLEKIEKEKSRLIKEKVIKKSKPLAPIKDEDMAFEIPDSWQWVRLGDLGEIIGGGTPDTNVKEYWEDGDIPWLTPADLNGFTAKYISKGRRNITKLGLQSSSARLLSKGSVLFSSRAPIGYVAIAENDLATNQGFKSCTTYILDMNEYIYYFLMYDAERINANASGTTFKEVSGKVVSNILVPLPALEEQKRITKRIAEVLELCDELEVMINNSQKCSQLLIKSVLKEIFKH